MHHSQYRIPQGFLSMIAANYIQTERMDVSSWLGSVIGLLKRGKILFRNQNGGGMGRKVVIGKLDTSFTSYGKYYDSF